MLKELERLEAEEKTDRLLFLGPFFLILSLALTLHDTHYELWFVVLIGLFCIWKWKLKGLLPSLALLFAVGAWSHLNYSSHLWQLGMETSIGMGFTIAAISIEEIVKSIHSLKHKVAKGREDHATLHLTLTETHHTYAQEKEELLTQVEGLNHKIEEKREELVRLSDLVDTLNEHLKEASLGKEALIHDLTIKTRKAGDLQFKLSEKEKEILQLQDQEALQKENMRLLMQLNEARVKTYQDSFVQEEMAALLEKEGEKLKVASEEIHLLKVEKEKLLSLIQEKEQAILSLRETVAEEEQLLRQDQALLEGRDALLENMNKEKEELSSRLKEKEGALQLLSKEKEEMIRKAALERSMLEESLEGRDVEIASLKEAVHKKEAFLSQMMGLKGKLANLEYQLAEKEEIITSYEERLSQTRQLEPAYFQLRKQFEEKNELLHETRSKIFQLEGELAAYSQEKEEKGLKWDPQIDQIFHVMRGLEIELESLRCENEALYALFSDLFKK